MIKCSKSEWTAFFVFLSLTITEQLLGQNLQILSYREQTGTLFVALNLIAFFTVSTLKPYLVYIIFIKTWNQRFPSSAPSPSGQHLELPDPPQIDSKLHIQWRDLSYLIREQMRVLGKVGLGLLCFILPGVWLLARYSLVPIVVLLDARYARGEVDALMISSQWMIGHTGKAFVLLFLWLIALPVTFLTWVPSFSPITHPTHAVLLASFDFLIFYMLCWYCWSVAKGQIAQKYLIINAVSERTMDAKDQLEEN
jgi:hypothetical protein